jgi:hypothetical protein
LELEPWPDPEPLATPNEEEQPYPLHALPKIMGDAIAEYQCYGQQPTSLIAGSAISAASLVVQGHVDVARDAKLIGPSSTYTAVIAISGERKTSCDNEFRKPLREWMAEEREKRKDETEEARSKVAQWEAARDGLLGKIKRASGNGTSGPANIEQYKKELNALYHDKPEEAIQPALFYEDVNPESLTLSLADGWSSASLWSDESGLVIGSLGMSEDSAMRFMGLLNRLWDGGDFERTRATAKSAIVRGRRFTVCQLMQPIVLAKLLTLCGGGSRKMGLIARYLLAWPRSTMGSRPYREPPPNCPAMDRFHRRLREILDRKLPTLDSSSSRMQLKPAILQLKRSAFELWREFHDATEASLGRSGEYAAIPDIAAKMPENAARLAAQFHVIELAELSGEVGEIEMEGAIAAASWYLAEARRIIEATEKPGVIIDAEQLLEWLLQQPSQTGIEPRAILRLGPAPLRDQKRRNAALDLLFERSCIRKISDAKSTRLAINPKLSGAPK